MNFSPFPESEISISIPLSLHRVLIFCINSNSRHTIMRVPGERLVNLHSEKSHRLALFYILKPYITLEAISN